MRWRDYGLPAAAGAATTAGLVAAVLAPPDRVQGELVRLMYVHVPAAWLAYLGFALTSAASAVWLWRRYPAADRLAGASAELGVVCTGLTLLLGSIWGKPVCRRTRDPPQWRPADLPAGGHESSPLMAVVSPH